MDTSASLSAGFSRTPARGWAVALLSRFQLSTATAISYSFGLYFPFIRQDLQMTPWEAGLLQGIWWVTLAVMALPCSVWFSRYRPGPLISLSLLLMVPFLYLQGLAATFVVLLLARLCFVLSQVIATPARPLVLQQWVAPTQYATVQAVGLSLHSTLLALSLSMSAWLITAVGSWRLAYFIQGTFFLGQTIVWLIVARDRAAPVQGLQQALQQDQETPIRALWRYPRGWFIGITMFALSATWTGIVTFLPTLLLENHDMPLTMSGPLLGCLYYALIPSSLIGGWLARKVPDRKRLLWIPALCNVLFGVALTFTASPWMIMALLTGIGIVWIVSPILEVLPFEFPDIRPREVSVLSALIRTLMNLGFAAGPMVVGKIAQWTDSLQTGLFVLCLLTGVGVVTGLLYPSHKAEPQN